MDQDLFLTYDADADAAYVYLRMRLFGGVAATLPVEAGGNYLGINLDFDTEQRLVGVEVLDAERRLPAQLLEQAVNPGELLAALQEITEEEARGDGDGEP